VSEDIYAQLATATGFDWNVGNAPKVRARHDVDPGECEQAFFSEPFLVVADVTHSATEQRWRALGQTLAGRQVFLVFTMRETLIRVISARNMNRKERREYAQAQKRTETDSDT
jgi:hypothetical protein